MINTLYLHGFLSKKNGSNGETLQNIMGADSIRVPLMPEHAITAVKWHINGSSHVKGMTGNIGLIGSSLGGFYATVLSQQLDLPCVLLNPSVFPSTSPILKQNPITHGAIEMPAGWVLPQAVDQLKELEKVEIDKPQNILALIQKGDELADYNKSIEHYNACEYIIIDGGSHRFDNLQDWIPEISIFFQQYYNNSHTV